MLIRAEVISDNSITFNDTRDYDELTASTLTPDKMACAVLDPLTKAGSVEFGVKGDGRVKEYGRDCRNAQLEAHHRRSARITGPWTAAGR